MFEVKGHGHCPDCGGFGVVHRCRGGWYIRCSGAYWNGCHNSTATAADGAETAWRIWDDWCIRRKNALDLREEREMEGL